MRNPHWSDLALCSPGDREQYVCWTKYQLLPSFLLGFLPQAQDNGKQWPTDSLQMFYPNPKTRKKALLHKLCSWQQWDPTAAAFPSCSPRKGTIWWWNLLHGTFFFHPNSCPLLLRSENPLLPPHSNDKMIENNLDMSTQSKLCPLTVTVKN